MAPDEEFPHETAMNDPKRRFFSGDTLQQAVIQAANYFNLDPSYVAYRSLEKRHGFLKTRRKVVIEVDPDNPRREAPVPLPMVPAGRSHPPAPPSGYLSREPVAPGAARPAPPPRRAEPRPEGGRPEGGRRERRGPRGERGDRREAGRERPRRRREEARLERPVRDAEAPRSAALDDGGLVTLPETPRRVADRFPVASGPLADAAAKAAELLIRIAGLELAPQIFQGEERLEVDLSGDDVDWCFADDGEFVMAVEHLLPRMIRSLCGEAVAVRVDCDNFHEIREERLRSLAQRMAEDVRRRGRPRILEPMNPADRRIIHVTLADDPGVVTESEGDGYFKRVTIRPV
ncbi:MAG TPA: R3H domain-containing nucleic acid-binding protein [Thermoanaerobaculia bacterium]|jgi:predicted RNA-binding protein Jag|nr:R3H domain-containing nucleic acid-binding protein [Thermoanaerobaculia bacterium]